MKTKKGFTLVELLVVIAIIGLLATIAFISLNSARGKARDAKRVSDIRQVMSALELYYADKGGYPADADAVAGAYIAFTAVALTGQMSNYIGQLPLNVTPADGSCTTANNPYGYSTHNADYSAECNTAAGTFCPTYRMRFCLGNTTGGLSSGVHTATPNGIN